jgi:hypothetical protein
MKYLFVGGVARSGKNTFCNIFQSLLEKDGKTCIQESFAKPLRAEMFEVVQQMFGLDVYTQNENEKNIIRPLMVDWAAIRRQKTNGNYFADKLKERLDLISDSFDYCLINDFRFGEYYTPETNNDELGLAKKLNGTIIHIKQYSLYEGRRNYIKPPNCAEKKNDPIINKHADHHVVWPKTDNQKLLEQYVGYVYKQVVK